MARRRARDVFNRPADHKTSRVTLVLAAVAVLGALAVITLLATLAPRGIPGVKYYELKARVRNSDDLRLLSPVLISGRRVGQVNRISHVGDAVQLNLQIQAAEGPLRSDTTGRVRIKNLVGAKYFELTPGLHGDQLPSGAVLATKQTSNATDLDQVLSTFAPTTRSHLQDTIDGAGKGFLGRGQGLNRMYSKTPRLLPDLDSVSKAVLARQGAAARFAPSVEALTRSYDPVRHELATGFRPQADVLDAFADPGSRLPQTLTVAPAALSGLRRGLDATNPLLRQTARLSRATARLTDVAPAALRQTTALLREGQPALRLAKPVIADLDKAAPPTLSFLHALDPVIRPTVRGLDDQVPLLRQVSAYGCDVVYMAGTWRSALSFGVPTGSDPTSNLDNNQGFGPNMNSFRVLSSPTLDPQSFPADSPQARTAASDPNPKPCVAKRDRQK